MESVLFEVSDELDEIDDDEPCEWCDKYLCNCDEAMRCICGAYSINGDQIADCVC